MSTSTETASDTSATTATPQADQFLASRSISRETSDRAGVAACKPSELQGEDALAFPYWRAGEVVGVKYRALGRKAFAQQKGGESYWFGLEHLVTPGDGRVYVTEGEMDALSIAEVGLEAVAWTAGANPSDVDADVETDARFAPAREAMCGRLAGKEIVLAGDMDDQGKALKTALARVFGLATVRDLDWPKGCKDANDALRALGPTAFREWCEIEARPWRIEGLFRLSEVPDRPPLTVWSHLFDEWEDRFALAPGLFSVMTGEPGMGKTHFSAQLAYRVAQRHEVRVGMASFETPVKPHYQRLLRGFCVGKRWQDLTAEEERAADAWIDDAYRFIQHPRDIPGFQWMLDTLEAAAVRDGCQLLIVDPWNRLEHARHPRESETEYIGRALTALMEFVRDLGVHLMVLAHPAKRANAFNPQTSKFVAPTLGDISGSKHWENRPDQGFVVHRERKWDRETNQQVTEAQFIVAKSRFQELGYERVWNLDFDRERNAYRSLDGPRYGGGVNPVPREDA
ncbi:MAG: DnaB-like helicase C-terminal domain-containing protein [Pseudomonadota bacterium]